MASFFFQDIRLAMVAKTCPRLRPSKRSIMVRRFCRKNTFCLLFVVRMSWLQVLQGIPVKKKTQMFEDVTA